MEMFILGTWLILAIMTGVAAAARGRSAFGWFLLAILITPVLALIALIAFPARKARLSSRACPQCAERIEKRAIICHYCRSDVAPVTDYSATLRWMFYSSIVVGLALLAQHLKG